MKHFLLTTICSILISIVVVILFYLYFPLSWLDYFVKVSRIFGSTITTINGTDTLSSSRAVINTNFSNLNTDKLQTGSSAASLTVTTLTGTNFTTNGITQNTTATSTFTGGISTLGVNSTNGINVGTGTSTFANGISITGGCLFFNSVCLTATAVTSVSNQDGAITVTPNTGAVIVKLATTSPVLWTASSTWSGGPISFTGTATTSILTLGVPVNALQKLAANPTNVSVSASTASTTLASFNVPAGILGLNNGIHGRIRIGSFGMNSADAFTVEVLYGGTNILDFSTTTGGVAWNQGVNGTIDFNIYSLNSTNSQEGDMDFFAISPTKTSLVAYGTKTGTAAIDSTVPQTLSVVARFNVASDAGSNLTTTDVQVYTIR